MSAVKITEGIYSVGIMNPNMRVFDIVMKTDSGTSYNSYLVRGSEKTALIETCHESFFEEYLENIKEVCKFEEIDYIVMNHNEPDHSGSLAKLLELMPNAQLIASIAGANYLKNITNRCDLDIHKVKDGEVLDLGGLSLTFLSAPNLHWPDSMFTWVKEANTLFTCDFLGCHYCEPYTFDTRIAYPKAYDTALELYYGAIFGPFASFVRKGLEKIKALPQQPDYICTSHGPVLTKEGRMQQVLASYEAWSAEQPAGAELIPVFYTSAYGNTAKLAKKIQEGILEAKPDADCQTYDIIEHDMAQLHALINHCKAVAVGSPTLNRDAVPPVWNLLAGVDAINSGKKPALVFGSYGWTGEAVGNIQARLQGLKMNVFEDGFKVAFVPTEDDLEAAKELGKNFAMSF